VPHRLTCNQQIVSSNRLSHLFKFGADRTRCLRVGVFKGKDRNRAGEKSFESLLVCRRSCAFVYSVPELKKYDGTNTDGFTQSEDFFKPAPNTRGLAIDERNAGVRIQQICHSKIFRVGVRG
jgi:hypothetical protein